MVHIEQGHKEPNDGKRFHKRIAPTVVFGPALLLLGYIVYRIIIKKEGGDKEMKSFSYYLSVIWGGIIYIAEKITGKN